MGPSTSTQIAPKIPRRFSFFFIAGTLILAGWLHLATPLIAALFAYLALTKLHFGRGGKWLTIILFLAVISGVAYGLGYVINQAVDNLPDIADKAIPSIIQWAKSYKIELPFTDYDSLKETAKEAVKSQVHYLGSFARFARGASSQFVFLIVGILVAINLFLNGRIELDEHRHTVRNNLYSICCDHVAERFKHFYSSFATVMGAQIIISAINTVLTSIFVLIVHLDNAVVVIGMTFLCGLIPVIGNLISNSIMVGIAFIMSPRTALIAFVFLIVIHKLEYLLNSKIVGDRIRNPLWLTLLGLIIGEKLMGIPGMILAPVVLNYIKTEAERVEVTPAPSATE
jgi:predicted PurR-regulated permease PerM